MDKHNVVYLALALTINSSNITSTWLFVLRHLTVVFLSSRAVTEVSVSPGVRVKRETTKVKTKKAVRNGNKLITRAIGFW